MATRLFVGNIPDEMTEDQLRELFSQTGEVGVIDLIITRHTGKRKGFGYVDMLTSESARAAVERFKGFVVANHALQVEEVYSIEAGFYSGSKHEDED
jgi:RNA recognition motif-containing protein